MDRLKKVSGMLKRVSSKTKGGLTMSKKICWGLLALFVGMLVFSGTANAAAEAQDTCLISVTPPSDYAIEITTASASDGIDLGTVGTLGEVRYNTTVATVTNSGSVVSDWKISVDNAADWMVNDSNNDPDTVGVDTVTICAVLAETTVAVPTDDTYFDAVGATDLLRTTAQNMSAGNYAYDTADGDNVGAASEYRLHIRMKTPSNTTVTAKQQFKVHIEAWASSTF